MIRGATHEQGDGSKKGHEEEAGKDVVGETGGEKAKEGRYRISTVMVCCGPAGPSATASGEPPQAVGGGRARSIGDAGFALLAKTVGAIPVIAGIVDIGVRRQLQRRAG